MCALRPANDWGEVRECVGLIGCDAFTTLKNGDNFAESLRHNYDLRQPTSRLYALLNETPQNQDEDVIDVLVRQQRLLDADAFVAALAPLRHRLYTIASSNRDHPHCLELIVSTVRYELAGRKRRGLASTFLADTCENGSEITGWIQPNERFRLPANDKNVLCIGPGTGVAPFLSFAAERAHVPADQRGAMWVFFGERQQEHDYYFQQRWQQWQADGVVDQVTTAFSRDQPQRMYVQDRLQEHATSVAEFISSGAVVYVCGDARQMAPAVRTCINTIMQQHGHGDNWVQQAQDNGDYREDVY